jgi:cell division protein FtsZ
MVFVTAGEGGGTGTGGAPVVAKIAKGDRRADHRRRHPPVHVRGAPPGQQQAESGIGTLREEVDTLIVIPNDRLLSISDRGIVACSTRSAAPTRCCSPASQGITDLITTPGLINLDFADVKSVMRAPGRRSWASARLAARTGRSRPPSWRSRAPLLEASIDGAHGVLLSIQGGSDLGLFEINEAARLVQEAAHPEANIIFGTVIDDALGDEVRVTVIAAGFDSGDPPAGQRPSSSAVSPRCPRSPSSARCPRSSSVRAQQPPQRPMQPPHDAGHRAAAAHARAGRAPQPQPVPPAGARARRGAHAPAGADAPASERPERLERQQEPVRVSDPARQPEPARQPARQDAVRPPRTVTFDDADDLDVPDFLK